MNTTPYWLLRVRDTIDGESRIDFAMVPMTIERIALLLARLESMSRLCNNDNGVVRIVFQDASLAYYECPDLWLYDPEDNPLTMALYKLEETNRPMLVAPSIFPEQRSERRTEANELHIGRDTLYWAASLKYSDVGLCTMSVCKEDLLLAQCYVAGPDRFLDAFYALAQEAPERALSLIESGLILVGGDDSPRRIPSEIAATALLSLLQHPNSTVRQRAIVALGLLDEIPPKVSQAIALRDVSV